MPENGSRTQPSKETLRDLQETVLKAVLLNKPLPGHNRPIVFRDLPFVLSQSAIILLDENLVGPVSIKELPKPVRILSRKDLLQEARKQEDFTYLSFQPPQFEHDVLLLTLEARISPRDPRQRALGLGGIQVKFRKVTGQWQAVDEPVYYAT